MNKPSPSTDRHESTPAATKRAVGRCLVVHDDLELRLRLGAVVRIRPADGSNGSLQGRLLVDLNLPGEDAFGDYVKRALTA